MIKEVGEKSIVWGRVDLKRDESEEYTNTFILSEAKSQHVQQVCQIASAIWTIARKFSSKLFNGYYIRECMCSALRNFDR